ncbi:MAG: type II secretion system protein [Limisphaerales bacterium]
MLIGFRQTTKRVAMKASRAAFTLVEVLVSIVIMALVMAGVCYGYAQANRVATFCSMQQAAESFALRGLEAARAAKFNPWNPGAVTNISADPGSQMELPPTNGAAALIFTNLLDVPIKGNPLTDYTYYGTNYIYVTWYPSNQEVEPPIELIRSVAVWTFPLTGKRYSNTVVTLRGPDQ